MKQVQIYTQTHMHSWGIYSILSVIVGKNKIKSNFHYTHEVLESELKFISSLWRKCKTVWKIKMKDLNEWKRMIDIYAPG